MNTSEVAKLLGVSASTVQRWVKQLRLPMEKNDRGHYHFTNDDINLFKEIHEQLQNGTLLHEITPVNEEKNIRKGAMKSVENDKVIEKLTMKVNELEISLNTKADSVASYQLLQHRREIEDLQDQVKKLSQQLELLQSQFNQLNLPSQIEKTISFEQSKIKRKKKNFVSSIFGF
ncbi:MerR family transcriptional regulator [Neobacillus jeddahensis]|uniref:MerR family transcriptional regulator n=1 Tax=Neobacillus jeddahensis TaxID=1461580 RepID=UPI00058CE4D6|nr:MerR family transcriptional regulator [Neobacillus jeddahensis]